MNPARILTMTTKYRQYGPGLFCVALYVVALAIAHPVLEMGMNDDWSYDFSARVLAQTGHVVYNGWATAMLGWQLYWGALFIRLFGFSFLVLRLSMLVLSAGTLLVFHRILTRLNTSVWNATIATLTLAFSPIFFSLGFSFMSDVPGLLTLLVCMYLCLRALQSTSDRAALGWLITASLSNVLLGTVRQTAWLGALILVPFTAWALGRRKHVLESAVALWLVSAGLISGCLRWFQAQPYSIKEPLFTKVQSSAVLAGCSDLVRGILSASLFLLPVLFAFLIRLPPHGSLARRFAFTSGVLLLLGTAFLAIRPRPVYWLLPATSNTFTAKGFNDLPIMLGTRPDILSRLGRGILTFVVVAALLAFVCRVIFARGGPVPQQSVDTQGQTPMYRPVQKPSCSRQRMTTRFLLLWLGPLTASYLFLMITRSLVWDRYLLPVLAVGLLFLLSFYQEHVAERLPVASAVMLVLFATADVAALHDDFALNRARLAAAAHLEKAGIPRQQIGAGFEYDAWTQLEVNGHVNDRRIQVPAGGFYRWTPPTASRECSLFFLDHTPDVVPTYELSLQPTTCLIPDPKFPAFAFSTWLSPHNQAIETGRVR